MKTILKLEEVAEFLLSIFLFAQLDFSWWVYPALILAPDLSMIGYAVSPAVGAVLYNFFHHKALGILVGITGFVVAQPLLMLGGIILFGHSALDRSLGYGLKYADSFQHTHLGKIGH